MLLSVAFISEEKYKCKGTSCSVVLVCGQHISFVTLDLNHLKSVKELCRICYMSNAQVFSFVEEP
jgi:hypothetical protein